MKEEKKSMPNIIVNEKGQKVVREKTQNRNITQMQNTDGIDVL